MNEKIEPKEELLTGLGGNPHLHTFGAVPVATEAVAPETPPSPAAGTAGDTTAEEDDHQ
ncbi:hypothetical protein [Fimbriimonas ginsengisoli]|uniref:Uncharacterized protein n=1 Tax=Fimbriimonas ginsengisoli Gsoil 348 TaxID=661478 RepID=A0A068NIX1_FIMGI|nr:hypothetical protein [Fimbriimonas ginsengisoli]AIE83533.1 hypothetical protein OP10G_0165 [Fimbriimonas ginsengisoli Gsoil 348]